MYRKSYFFLFFLGKILFNEYETALKVLGAFYIF